MNRTVKAVVMGIALVFGLYLTVLVLRAVLVLGILMLPFLILAAVIYFVGYGMPKLGSYGRKIHKGAETKARQGLDWLDFNAPHWSWPIIATTRAALDWLGLQVARI